MAKNEIVIFDLDGCISDDEWRLPFILDYGNDRYLAYHKRLQFDKPLPWGSSVLKEHLAAGRFPVFITARPWAFEEETRHWLRDHFELRSRVDYMLLMRRSNDYRPSTEVKLEYAKAVFSMIKSGPRNCIHHAYDDREDIVKMYLDLGINASILNKNGVSVVEYVMERDAEKAIESEAEISSGKTRRRDAADILARAAETFSERNAVYKDNAVAVGNVMKALFPNGITIRSSEDHHLYHLFELIVVKLTRFANSGLTHADSIHDAAVYAAMVECVVDKHNIEVL